MKIDKKNRDFQNFLKELKINTYSAGSDPSKIDENKAFSIYKKLLKIREKNFKKHIREKRKKQ